MTPTFAAFHLGVRAIVGLSASQATPKGEADQKSPAQGRAWFWRDLAKVRTWR
jgi:hypothetical protein